MRARVFWLLILSYTCPLIRAQTFGEVHCTVVSQSGVPVPLARVEVVPMPKPGVLNKIYRYCFTDSEGRCTITNVPWGEYRVFAGKDSEGYPDLPFPIYGVNAFPIVKLQPASPSANAAIRLSPKAGAIEPVSVIDAATGEVLRSAAIVISLARNPEVGAGTSTASYPIMVPSDTDVFVQITASGYKPWPAKEREKEGQIRLKPEEAVELDVKIAPEGSAAESSGTFRPAILAWRDMTPAPAPTPASKILASPVDSFTVTAADISVPIVELAKRYRVQIGFVAKPQSPAGNKPQSLRIDVKAGTVRNVLNAIVAADPAYTWEEAEHGVINVLPKEHVGSLPEIVVKNYSDTNVYRDEAISDLLKTAEVRQWMEETGATRRDKGNANSHSSRGEFIGKFEMRNSTVISILNCMHSLTNSLYWEYYRAGESNQFFVITMSD